MRRVAICLMLSVLALSQMGCILAVDVKGWPHDRQVIEIDGEIYVVDIKTNGVRKISRDSATEIESTTRLEIDTTNE